MDPEPNYRWPPLGLANSTLKINGLVHGVGGEPPIDSIHLFRWPPTPISGWFGPSAVYGITVATEAIARAMGERTRPEPVHRYELEPPAQVEIGQPVHVHFHDDELEG